MFKKVLVALCALAMLAAPHSAVSGFFSGKSSPATESTRLIARLSGWLSTQKLKLTYFTYGVTATLFAVGVWKKISERLENKKVASDKREAPKATQPAAASSDEGAPSTEEQHPYSLTCFCPDCNRTRLMTENLGRGFSRPQEESTTTRPSCSSQSSIEAHDHNEDYWLVG